MGKPFLTPHFSYAKIHPIRYVSLCASGTFMTGSVRFPVEILVNTSCRDREVQWAKPIYREFCYIKQIYVCIEFLDKV